MRDIKEILNDITTLEDEVYHYIKSTPNWICYWLDNPNIKDFLIAHPDDYNQNVSLELISIDTSMFTCNVYLYERETDTEECVELVGFLSNFRQTVEARWKEWKSDYKQRKIKEIEEGIVFHKEKVVTLEKELNKLKEQINESTTNELKIRGLVTDI